MSGKTSPGDIFYATKSMEEAAEEAQLQAEFGKEEGALDLDTYCHIKGITDPAMVAGMKAYTKIKKAIPGSGTKSSSATNDKPTGGF